MKKVNNYIFISMIVVIFLCGIFPFIREQKYESVLENRALNKIPAFNFNEYLSGQFQDELEVGLSDQFLGGENIRRYYNSFLKNVSKTIETGLKIKENGCKNEYVLLDNGRAVFDCSDYIVFLPNHSQDHDIIMDNIKSYSKLNDYVDTYYYYIPSTLLFDFRNNSYVDDYVNIFKDYLKDDNKIDYLKFNNYDEYKKYFYKNDHHWNYIGSYQGYKDIYNLLNLKEGLMIPTGTYNSHEPYYGSHSRLTRNYDFYDEFKIYTFDFKKYKTYINRKEDKYDHIEDFVNHNYQEELDKNYYGYVYGIDYAEVIFDFDNKENDNLLIIANSLSNAVNELIASHFNKTYVIDLRYYKEEFKKDFKVLDYIKQNNINKVLFIMNIDSLKVPDIGLEE